MKSKADLIMTVQTEEGKVIYSTPVAPHLVNHPYPGGPPGNRLMISNSIMAEINTKLEKWCSNE